ncbi:hypothetical protein [Mesorhizobium sp. LjNodule214]|uniref:hypothetical protein n=1 Tax=Mesorhizobium sp. LjNodule214 TaxID=3342252 RepID=UPI003ECE9E3D
MMLDFYNLERAKARLRVKRAETSLKRTNKLLDQDCGAVVGVALCDSVRSAQRRLIEAKERLTKIDPRH